MEEYIGLLFRFWPGYEGMILRRALYKMLFKKIGKKSIIFSNAYLTHTYNISAGNCLAINSGAFIDGRGGIEIGDNVLIGPHVFIGSSNHAVETTNGLPRIFVGHIPKMVKIGSNVWIGAHAVICPGANIGDNSVIGAGSVVVSDIPDSVVACGSPCEVKKTQHKQLKPEGGVV
ncbi:MAG: DapH/DapD/GlmU-related protein [Candidatus Omnitrophica bacterium]|nr:DapH/DapD/GlmU-related protein [Candidatus Omnitrophota bacterium]MDD5591849.1 DapH/DapD/GlmU-related protein [Candidatus Omnitrophota bacterium]